MPPSRKVSPRQLQILIDFLEANRDLASGRCSRGPLAVQITDRAWVAAAAKLNSVADGVTKPPSQWRRYWVEWKAKTKAKAADIRRNAAGTGGGPNRLVPLNDMEQRVIGLISHIAVAGHQEALLPNPFSSPSQPGPSTQTSHAPQPGPLSQTPHSPQPSPSSETPYSPQPGPSSQTLHSPKSGPSPPSQSPLPDYTEEEWLEEDREVIPSISTSPPKSPHQPSVPPPAPSATQWPAAAETHLTQRIKRLRSKTLRDIPQWVREIEEKRMAIDEAKIVNEDRVIGILQKLDSRLANIQSGMVSITETLAHLTERFQ